MLQDPEEVPSIDNEESDGSVHSHILPMLKAPPIMPPTPIRRNKAQDKNNPSKVAPSIWTPVVLDDLEEVFAPHDPKRTSTVSPPHVALKVFVRLYFPTTYRLIFIMSSYSLYTRNLCPF